MKTKRFYTHLLPLLLPACAVDTPVADDSAHFDEFARRVTAALRRLGETG